MTLVTTPGSLKAGSHAVSALVLTEFSEMLSASCAERPTHGSEDEPPAARTTEPHAPGLSARGADRRPDRRTGQSMTDVAASFRAKKKIVADLLIRGDETS